MREIDGLARDGSCHPDCGPVVIDGSDIRGGPLVVYNERSGSVEHAHEDEEDGRCWHEHGPIGAEVRNA